ncbi:MAG: glycoside hydrolase family 97 protein [Acidobacteria bacterium]|nr:glycoside hydrolase family 97 protein [Acidobacteriota bacterium]
MTLRVAPLAFLAAVAAFPAAADAPRTETLASPDGRVVATLTAGEAILYSLEVDGRPVLDPAPLALALADGPVLGRGSRIVRVDRRDLDETIPTPLGKRASVRNHGRELALVLADGATLRVRVYDDGLALRWETELPGRIRIAREHFNVAFPEEPEAFMLQGSGNHHHGYEGLWTHGPVSALGSGDQGQPLSALLPIVFDPPRGPKLALLQADLVDYPVLYLRYRPSRPRQMSAVFPRRALAEAPGGFRDFDLVVTERSDDIAETSGTRSFPWRAFVVARRDADLLGNDMVTRLPPAPADGADFSWVKAGKVVWDYWANWNLEGVDFVAGRNDETFRYHIDFAARNGFEYVNLDWHWTDPHDLFAMNPEVDAPGLIRYARDKGVGIFVWCLSRTLERQLEPALDRFEKWGVAGLKIDFFDRDDQRMVNVYRRFAEEAAKRKMLVLFHGATAPTGLSREFPNVVGYEAVRGLEYDKFNEEGSTPPHEVTIPYTRMLAGPVDFTPGAMRALNRANWRAVHDLPSSQGTVARQLAMYVLYQTAIPMLSDMPTAYEREPDALEFLKAVPTTWDETLGLDGRIGEWAVLARQKGDEWWVAAMTDWDRRTVNVPLSFLDDGTGSTWEATLWVDGVNADKVGTDYRRTVREASADGTLRLDLAPGGGAVARLRRK